MMHIWNVFNQPFYVRQCGSFNIFWFTMLCTNIHQKSSVVDTSNSKLPYITKSNTNWEMQQLENILKTCMCAQQFQLHY